MPQLIDVDFIGDGGSRANKRHVSFENIEELRKFVKAAFAKEWPNSRVAWIFRDFERRALRFVDFARDETLYILLVDQRITAAFHGPEFKKGKRSSILADPLLFKENRTLRADFDRQRDQNEQGR